MTYASCSYAPWKAQVEPHAPYEAQLLIGDSPITENTQTTNPTALIQDWAVKQYNYGVLERAGHALQKILYANLSRCQRRRRRQQRSIVLQVCGQETILFAVTITASRHLYLASTSTMGSMGTKTIWVHASLK